MSQLAWSSTPLHVKPPSIPMVSGDRIPLNLDAGEPIVDADARMVRLGTTPPVDVSQQLVADVNQEDAGCTVTIIGGERGGTYELTVTFTNAAGRRWSRLLTVLVVA